MGHKFQRKKIRNVVTSLVYRLAILPFASRKRKFHLYSDLSWIFHRLSQEYSFGANTSGEHPARKLTLNYMRKEVGINDTILDVGCSSGEYSFALSEVCKEVIGVDYDKKAIDWAKTKYKNNNLSFICADALDYLQKNDRSFDVMICSHVLEHLEDPGEFISQYKQYFRKIYIEVPDFDNSNINILRENFGLPLIYTDSDHIYEFSREDVEEIIINNGLKIISCEFRYGVMRYWAER